MAEHNDFGVWGEDMAQQYMVEQGYSLLHRDWRCGHRDLDLVMYKDGIVVFVEVKARANDFLVSPEQAVDVKKIRSLSIAANAYVKKFRINADLRLDIVAITGTISTGYKINHIPDAFYPIR